MKNNSLIIENHFALSFSQQAYPKIHENSKNFVKGRFISFWGFLQP